LQEAPLPKLPVPSLEQTMDKYEYTMRPLLNTEEQRKLKHLIEKFSGPGCLGRQLQLYLLDRQEKMDNWVSVCPKLFTVCRGGKYQVRKKEILVGIFCVQGQR
jgi:pyrroloquinoline quinone (PQQ) biosynthesis protein C